jgi:hypothetical protein
MIIYDRISVKKRGVIMNPNELKKNDHIILKNGWRAVILDNRKSYIRLAEVSGFCTEIGSIYIHDIASVIKEGKLIPVTLNDKQRIQAKKIHSFGF